MTTPSPGELVEPTRCATHPNVETNLRCGKCGKPICPRCMYQTPTGIRCRECAHLQRPVLYQLSTKHYAAGIGAGLALGVAMGVVWGLVRLTIPLAGLFDILVAAGAGYIVGEGVSRAANRRRGTPREVSRGAVLSSPSPSRKGWPTGSSSSVSGACWRSWWGYWLPSGVSVSRCADCSPPRGVLE